MSEQLTWADRRLENGFLSDTVACTACRVAQQATAVLVDELQREPGKLARDEWRGICATHAWFFANADDALRRLVEARLQQAVGALQATHAARRQTPSLIRGADRCPCCAAIDEAVNAVLADVKAEDLVLCLPHFLEALMQNRQREELRALGEKMAVMVGDLETDLSELIRKSDYRFRDEPRGREANAWIRAAYLFGGTAGVYWPGRRQPGLEGGTGHGATSLSSG